MNMRESIPSGKHLALLATAAALTLAPSSTHGDSQGQAPIADDGALTSQPAQPPTRSQAAERGVLGNCTAGLLCGRIKNRDGQQSIRITTNWGRKWDRATWRSVKPGQTGREALVRDVDGLYVKDGCKVRLAGIRTIGPGWYKIFDGQYIQVSDIRC
jgi:hypothetical protein